MNNSLLNQEVARYRSVELRREAANERLARQLRSVDEPQPAPRVQRWRLALLRPAFRTF